MSNQEPSSLSQVVTSHGSAMEVIETPFGTAYWRTNGKDWFELRFHPFDLGKSDSEYSETDPLITPLHVGRCHPMAGSIDGRLRETGNGWSIRTSLNPFRDGKKVLLGDITDTQRNAVWNKVNPWILEKLVDPGLRNGDLGQLASKSEDLGRKEEQLTKLIQQVDALKLEIGTLQQEVGNFRQNKTFFPPGA